VPALIATGNEDVISTGENISKWSKHFTTEPEYQLFSGGHFFIFEHLTDFISAILKFVNKNSSR
jgi:surfactin synthase thioesterase subunit